jgi:ribosomal protein S18
MGFQKLAIVRDSGVVVQSREKKRSEEECKRKKRKLELAASCQVVNHADVKTMSIFVSCQQ